MRISATVALVILITSAAAPAAAAPPNEDAVKTAIDNFEPLWNPAGETLRGWTIAIHAEHAGDAKDERLRADLALLTAHHLRHFIKSAAGAPLITRADTTRTTLAEPARQERAIATIRAAACQLCVSITFTTAEPRQSTASTTEPRQSGASAAEPRASAHAAVRLWNPRKHDSPQCASSFLQALSQSDQPADLALCEVRIPQPDTACQIDIETRRACRDAAREIYDRISEYCQNAANPAPSPPAAANARAAALAEAIWPAGKLPPERADWFCRRFADLAITNPTLVFFDVSAEIETNTIVLRGRTNVSRILDGLEQTLHAAGLTDLRNEVQLLPNRERLGEQFFGVCRAPEALTFNRPRDAGGLQTQLLLGEPLHLLDRQDDCYLLHAGDGYWGWVTCDAVQPMTADEFDAWLQHPRAVLLEDIRESNTRIPRGATLPAPTEPRDSSRAPARATGGAPASESETALLLPDGREITVPSSAVRIDPPHTAAAATRRNAALDLLYAPYVFGGRSPLGLDCSGMITNIAAQVGEASPRDARQQAVAGALVAVPWRKTDIRPGDQLFFIDEFGKVYHTGVAIDAAHIVHASPPCVQINSLDPHDPLYNRTLDRNFLMAKRP